MTNRPKQIGTAAETALVRYARAHGHPQARRLTLTGSHDQGDILLGGGIILEVKAGHAAETASDTQINAWWGEAVRERDNNPDANLAVLVTKRKGVSGARCGAWSAWMDADTNLTLTGAPRGLQAPPGVGLIRMSVDSLLALTTIYTQ